MNAKLIKYVSLLGIIIITIFGCSGHPKINMDESYQKIKPFAPLPQYVQKEQKPNLIVKIDNVADTKNSYKNYVELYVNNFHIKTDDLSNIKRKYNYQLTLQPGIYKVRAKYYASTGWKIKTFDIETREDVMIFPNKVAKLYISLKKNSWGGLTEGVAYFDVSYKALNESNK